MSRPTTASMISSAPSQRRRITRSTIVSPMMLPCIPGGAPVSSASLAASVISAPERRAHFAEGLDQVGPLGLGPFVPIALDAIGRRGRILRRCRRDRVADGLQLGGGRLLLLLHRLLIPAGIVFNSLAQLGLEVRRQ